jgi:hypothetical protein
LDSDVHRAEVHIIFEGIFGWLMIALPRISIVTSSCSQGKFIDKTIMSVIEQGYLNLFDATQLTVKEMRNGTTVKD